MVTLLKNSPFTCSPNYPASWPVSKISNVLPRHQLEPRLAGLEVWSVDDGMTFKRPQAPLMSACGT